MTTTAKKKDVLKVAKENYYGTGKRKSAIAKAWVFPGKGRIEVNHDPLNDAVPQEELQQKILRPLALLNIAGKYDVFIRTIGGGPVGQADACQLAIARALVEMNQEFRSPLKQEGLLTRDSRIKERKKYGRKKARKGFQYRKR